MKQEKPALPAKVKWMQRFFAVAGNIAPNALLPVLVKLLFTPQKHTLKPPHLECLKGAEKLHLKVPRFRDKHKTHRLAAYRWGTGSKLVLLVHGWDAKALDYYKMIPALVQAGYSVVAFDGPGHGASEGESSNLLDFIQILPVIIQQVGTPYAIVGHSMGAGACAYMLMNAPVPVPRLVLLAMPVVSRYFLDESFKFMRIPRKMQHAFFKAMEQEFGHSIDTYNLMQRTEPIKAERILYVYEEFDEEVPVEHVLGFLERHPRVTPMMVSHVGHNRVMKHPRVIQQVVEFLA